MGVFSDYQPQYARVGVATFPVMGETKKPAIRGWREVGLKGSAELANNPRFADLENIAYLAGPKNKLTVVDVDTSDENVWREAEQIFGPSPVMVRTGSGNVQFLYRYGGERRDTTTRALGCIDLLGWGQVLGAPSKRGGGYQLIRGTLADLQNLPGIRSLGPFADARDLKRAANESRPPSLVPEGGRATALLRFARSEACHCDTLEALIDACLTYADDHFERLGAAPFLDDEVKRTARSVWDWTQQAIREGQYFVGKGRSLQVELDTYDSVAALGPHALALFMHLRTHRYHEHTFTVPNNMRNDMPGGRWALEAFQRARNALVTTEVLVLRQAPTSVYGAARYAWGRR